MSLLSHVIKSTTSTPFRILRCDTLRTFSTAADQPPPSVESSANTADQPPPSVESSVNTVLQDTPGPVYGKLHGVERHTLKSDIIHFFDGSNLRSDDLKVSYNSNFAPIETLIQFPSRSAYIVAQRSVGKKGRIFRLEKAGRAEWDSLKSYDGKAVLLAGLAQNAALDDIERFLAGCDSSSVTLMTRQGFRKMALVHFPSRIAAANAFITKNRGFCLNNQVTMRVLE